MPTPFPFHDTNAISFTMAWWLLVAVAAHCATFASEVLHCATASSRMDESAARTAGRDAAE